VKSNKPREKRARKRNADKIKKTVTMHTVKCRDCNKKFSVSSDVIEVLCGDCTLAQDIKLFGTGQSESKKEKNKAKNNYPRGWHFMKEFVSEDGKVFHKGVEQPKLFGKLEATVIEKSEKKKKLSKQEKEEGFRVLSAELENEKKKILKLLKSGANKKSIKKIEKYMTSIRKKRRKFL